MRPPRAAGTIAAGTFLVLSSGTLVLVLAAGDRVPLWMIGAWLVLAMAVSLVAGALVPPGGDPPEAGRDDAPEVVPSDGDYTSSNGVDPAITGEPREERGSPGPGAAGSSH